MKNLTKILLIILAGIFFGGSCNCAKDIIKIGAILPLTGPAAQAGINTKEGIDLAVDMLNENGGYNGQKIQVIYEDTKGEPKTGVTAIGKLITIDKVQYIIDNSLSSVTLAVAPVAEKNKVILLSTGGTSPKISEAGEYIFRIWNSDDLEGLVMANFVVDSLHISNIAILHAQNEYGLGLKEVFMKQLSNKNIKINIETFEESSSSFQTQLIKILSYKPQSIYIVGYPNSYMQIFKQLKENNYKGTVIGTGIFSDPGVTEIIKKTGYKSYYPVPYSPDSTSSSTKSFRANFMKKYKKEPSSLCDVGFDAIMLFIEAAKNGEGLNGYQIKDGLIKIKSYEGASGIIEFDKNGDVQKPIKISTLN